MKFALLLLAAILFFKGTAMAETKEPPFKIVRKENAIELREYGPMIIAEVTTEGERKEAIEKGFDLLADYIFGNNMINPDIDMTKPIAEQMAKAKGEKIAMTAPVTQQASVNKDWKVHFIMPEGSTLQSLPKPKNLAVSLQTVPAEKFVVIRFSGLAGDESLTENTLALREWIAKNGLKESGSPVYAFYNPPWTLPFLRRNEVMIRLAPK